MVSRSWAVNRLRSVKVASGPAIGSETCSVTVWIPTWLTLGWDPLLPWFIHPSPSSSSSKSSPSPSFISRSPLERLPLGFDIFLWFRTVCISISELYIYPVRSLLSEDLNRGFDLCCTILSPQLFNRRPSLQSHPPPEYLLSLCPVLDPQAGKKK